ncbi:hypothetical protein ACWCV5_27990 [Streptomyces tubercidicus]
MTEHSMTERLADLLIRALQDAGIAAHHDWTDVGYSSVFVGLDGIGVIRISDRDCSAHHSIDDHIYPLWAVYLPDPAVTEVLETIYEGAYGTPIADDITACVRAVSHFIAAFDVYRQAPPLQEEHEDLVRTMRHLPVRERLIRRAALADRSSLAVAPTDGKAAQDLISAARKLALHDREHRSAAGPLILSDVTARSPAEDLRAYIRQEYGAWAAAR